MRRVVRGWTPRAAVSLTSQPLALIRLIPWPPLFYPSWKSLCHVCPLRPGPEGMPSEDRSNPSAALCWESGLLDLFLLTHNITTAKPQCTSVSLCVTGNGSVFPRPEGSG